MKNLFDCLSYHLHEIASRFNTWRRNLAEEARINADLRRNGFVETSPGVFQQFEHGADEYAAPSAVAPNHAPNPGATAIISGGKSR